MEEGVNKKWVSGTMTFLYKGKKGITDIRNNRPITLLNIIYKFRAMIMKERLSAVSNIVTTELQTAYKSGRSTLEILTINTQIKTDGTKHIIMLGLSKAFDSVGRELLWRYYTKQGYRQS